MLINTFCHLAGIGSGIEQRLWRQGILDWYGFNVSGSISWSQVRKKEIAGNLQESQRHLEDNDSRYFTRRLPSRLHWRLFPEFKHTAVYLDIETTGLNPYGSRITTIALYDGRRIAYYVRGRNLEDFKTDIQQYGLIVSYNGKTFDVPFIERDLDICLPQGHIDLRYVLSSLGVTGGLKRCEVSMGIERGELNGVDGFWAVRLWNEYQQSGNQRVLNTLLAYNIQDVINLETLMFLAYNRKVSQTPFAESRQMPVPVAPVNPFTPDRETMERIRYENFIYRTPVWKDH